MEYAGLCYALKMAAVNETLMKDVCMYFMTWSASTNLIYGVRTFHITRPDCGKQKHGTLTVTNVSCRLKSGHATSR